MLNTVQHTAASAAHAMTEGSEALCWALEQGIITDREYSEAEAPFDAAQNKVFDAAFAEAATAA